MKKIFKQIVKGLKIGLVIGVIAGALFLGFKAYTMGQPVEYINNTVTDNKSDYEKKVEAKIKESSDVWKEKQRVWAEQEVSKEIIAEQEARLEELRAKEMGLE